SGFARPRGVPGSAPDEKCLLRRWDGPHDSRLPPLEGCHERLGWGQPPPWRRLTQSRHTAALDFAQEIQRDAQTHPGGGPASAARRPSGERWAMAPLPRRAEGPAAGAAGPRGPHAPPSGLQHSRGEADPEPGRVLDPEPWRPVLSESPVPGERGPGDRG